MRDQHLAEQRPGQRERHIDRLDLVDDDQRIGVVRLHQIAGLDKNAPDLAAERRTDVGVGQRQFGRSDTGLTDPDARRGRVEIGPVLFHLVGRDVVLLGDRRIALHMRARLAQRGLVLRQRGVGLMQRGLGRARIDAEQRLVQRNRVAVLDERTLQLSVDQRFDRDAVDCLDRADRGREFRHLARDRLDHRDRRRRDRRRRLFACTRR